MLTLTLMADGEFDDSSIDTTHTIESPASEDLRTTLAYIRDFLQGVGFPYITELVAVCDEIEHSSEGHSGLAVTRSPLGYQEDYFQDAGHHTGMAEAQCPGCVHAQAR